MSPVSTALMPCPNRPSLFATEGEGFEENSGINENAGIPQWYLNSQRQKNRRGKGFPCEKNKRQRAADVL